MEVREHKFFIKELPLDLNRLQEFLLDRYEEMENGFILNKDVHTRKDFDNVASMSTREWTKYNLFQFYDEQIHELLLNIKDLVIAACDHYKIDFYNEHYMVQSWFNVFTKDDDPLPLHDHWGGEQGKVFHGYFSVNAEPSQTRYIINNETESVIENRNNFALLSETGHPHEVSRWNEDFPRITIAYDCLPVSYVRDHLHQHYVYL